VDNYPASQFNERISDNADYDSYKTYISIYDIKAACRRQRHGKATGPDDMAMEALLYGTNRLYTHLAILFNLFINFGHLPPGFMQSVMIPLVKKQIW